MNPYPFASLNHFTCPCAILRPLSSGVFSPCVLPPSWRGSLPELAGKPVLRTNKNAAGRLSARRVSIYSFTRSDSWWPKNRGQELHAHETKSTRFYGPRDRPRTVPGPEPSRDGDRESPGGSARYHDVNLLRRRELRDHLVGAGRYLRKAQIGALAVLVIGHQGPIGDADALVQPPGQILAGPPISGQSLRVLRADHQHRVGVEREVLAVPEAGHRPAERASQARRGPARMIRDPVRRVAREQRDGAGVGAEPPRDVIGRPRARLLVLGDAVRVAAGMTEGRHRDLAGPHAAAVDHQQAQCAPDGGVGAEAGAEDAERGVETDARTDGTVDDDQRCREVRGGRHA